MTREQQTLKALAGTPSQVAAMLTGSDCDDLAKARIAYRHVRKANPTMPAWSAWSYIWRIIRAGTFVAAFPNV